MVKDGKGIIKGWYGNRKEIVGVVKEWQRKGKGTVKKSWGGGKGMIQEWQGIGREW